MNLFTPSEAVDLIAPLMGSDRVDKTTKKVAALTVLRALNYDELYRLAERDPGPS